MFFKFFIILCVLNKINAIPQKFKRDNESAIWIYNEYLDSCLYVSDFLNEPVVYDICDNTNNSKWYLDENDNGIYFKSATHKEMCLSAINDEIVLSECDENTAMKYIEAPKLIKNSNLCLSVIDDNNESEYLMLKNCDRNDKKLIFDIQVRRPNKKNIITTTTSTTTINQTPTSKPVWIYNEFTDKCLFGPEYENEIPTFEKCDNTNEYQWYIENTKGGSYFKSKINLDLCIRVSESDNSKLLMGNCDENAILRFRKNDGTIVSKFSESLCLGNSIESTNNNASRKRNKVILYDCYDEIHEDQIWTMLNSKPTIQINTITTTSSTTTTTATTTTINQTPTSKPVWIYNEYINGCLYAPEYINENLIYKECDSTDEYQWYIVNTKEGSYFKSKNNLDLCIRVSDNDNSKLLMGDCDENAILRYHKADNTITSKFLDDMCLGDSDSESLKLRKKLLLYDCSEEINLDQIWIIMNDKPSKKIITKTTTKTTTISTTTASTTTKTKTTTGTTTSPTINTTNRCGKNFDGKSCVHGMCCSQYGYCGMTDDYCGMGCQSAYGRCNNGGRCGTNYGKCLDNSYCCSQYNYCSISDKHCGTGCQPEFGLCYTTDINNRCGEKYGRCKSNECCSKKGYCGTGNAYCGTGCQSRFGLCY